jgi:phenylalanyl-tRNA synthetase alpha chain
MNDIDSIISALHTAFTEALARTHNQVTLEAVRVEFLGRTGKVADLMAQFKDFSLEQKRLYGPSLNELKMSLQNAWHEHKKKLDEQITTQNAQKYANFDVTTSTYNPVRGSQHIYSQLIAQLEDIFSSMGYELVSGAEVATDFYNFEALNIPKDHPARDMQDTFWIADHPHLLLRTHTSSVQVQAMQTRKPPLALFAAGRVYRNEATDASHDFMFYQGEFLLVDKNISLSHLLATTKMFLQTFFEKKDLQIQVRPSYFPFVEPGIEIHASCPFCTSGCSTCKKTGWIELLGAGLIHPHVLRAAHIDPTIYTGFACGFGLTRLAMIKYGIPDIRLLQSNKIAFLEQYGFLL